MNGSRKSSGGNSETVLVTGSAGFTGRYLVAHLESLGYNAQFPSMAFIKSGIDVRDIRAVSEFITAFGPTKLIHLAAISRTQNVDSEALWQINDLGTRNVIDAFIAHSPSPDHFVLASTAQVYSGSEKPIQEGAEISPQGEYAKSKFAAEERVLSLAESLRVSVVRPFNYTGVGQPNDFLMPKLVEAFSRGLPTLSLGNTEVIRDFSDVRDVVAAYGHILSYQGSGEIFNVCRGSGARISEIVESLSKIFDRQLTIEVKPELLRRSEPAYFVGDCSKISSYFGWSSKHELFETLTWMSRSKG